LVCVGQGIGIAGLVAFRRAKTTVNPVKASLASSLVVRGVYRYTRKRMLSQFQCRKPPHRPSR